jgi:hypothetical protein
MRRIGARLRKIPTQNVKAAKQFDAHRSICELQERVNRLEQLVAGLTGTGTGYVDGQIPSGDPKRPGPKPVHIWSLRSDRDQLVRMLENYWPEIEPFCLPQPDAEGLKSVFRAVARAQQRRHEFPALHLLRHLPDVVKFLTGDRFRRDPRQIANAFAGFTKISIWRSLKICQAESCLDPIGGRSIRAYIQRKHIGLYRDFAADFSLVNFASALRRYRIKDSKLKAYNASALYNCWKGCTSNYADLKLGTSAAVSRHSPETTNKGVARNRDTA